MRKDIFIRQICYGICIISSLFIFISSTSAEETPQERYKDVLEGKCLGFLNEIKGNSALFYEYDDIYIKKTFINSTETELKYQYHLYGFSSKVKYQMRGGSYYYYHDSSDYPYVQYVYYTCNNEENKGWQLNRYGTIEIGNGNYNQAAFMLKRNFNHTNYTSQDIIVYSNFDIKDENDKIIYEKNEEWDWEEINDPTDEDKIQNLIDKSFGYEYGEATNDKISSERIDEVLIRISNTKIGKLTREIFTIMPNWLWAIILAFIIYLITLIFLK